MDQSWCGMLLWYLKKQIETTHESLKLQRGLEILTLADAHYPFQFHFLSLSRHTFWHSEFIAPPQFNKCVCSEKDLAVWSFFPPQTQSHSGVLAPILSAVCRGLSPALLQPSVPRRARGGSRINHRMMKQMCCHVVCEKLCLIIGGPIPKKMFSLIFQLCLCVPIVSRLLLLLTCGCFVTTRCVCILLLWFVWTYWPDGWDLQHTYKAVR